MDTTSPHDARIDFQLSAEHKQLIEQAATLSGQSLADFAVASLIEMAKRRIDESTVTRLSVRDRDIFLNLLESDDDPNQASQEAAQRYRERRA